MEDWEDLGDKRWIGKEGEMEEFFHRVQDPLDEDEEEEEEDSD